MITLLNLVNIIIAAKIGGFISKKFGQPAVLGEILAGMIIGPHVFGATTSLKFLSFGTLDPLGKMVLDPFIKGTAELGVVLLLFLVGLNLDPKRIKENLKEGAWVGSLGVVIPFLVGLTLAYVLISNTSDMLTTTVVPSTVAMIFFASLFTATSISITAKVLMELNQVESKPFIVIMNAAVMDNVITVLLFTVTLAIVTTGTFSLNHFLVIGLSLGLFFALVLIVAPRIVGPLVDFGKYLDLRVEEGLFSIILAFIFLLAVIAQRLEVEPIIGAFLIGVIFSEESLGKEVVESFEKISYGFFVPIFFTTIGGYIDPLVVLEKYPIVLLIFMCQLFGKTTGSYIGSRISGLTKMDALIVGFGMVPLLEVALIVSSLGLEQGILTTSDFSILVTSFMLTVVSAPVLIKSSLYLKKHTFSELLEIHKPETTIWIAADPLIFAPGEEGVLNIHVKNIGSKSAHNVRLEAISESIDFLSPQPDVPVSVEIPHMGIGEEIVVELTVKTKDNINAGGRFLLLNITGPNITHRQTHFEVVVIEPEIDIYVDESLIAIGKGWPSAKIRLELSNPSHAPLHDVEVEVIPQTEAFNVGSTVIDEIDALDRASLEMNIVPKIKELTEHKYMFEIIVSKGKKKISSRFCEALVVNQPLIDFETIKGSTPALYHDFKLSPGETGIVLFRLKNWGWLPASNINIALEVPDGFDVRPKHVHIASIKEKEHTEPIIFRYKTKKNFAYGEYLMSLNWSCDEIRRQEKNAIVVILCKQTEDDLK